MIKISDEQFVATWMELQSPQRVADALGVEVRGVYKRRNNLVGSS